MKPRKNNGEKKIMAWKEIKAMTAWEFEMIRAMEGYDWMLANDVVNREDQKETGYIGCMTMYYQKQDDEFSESWHSRSEEHTSELQSQR